MSSTQSNVLMWFRADLRTIDNTALFNAAKDAAAVGGSVIAVFLLAPGQWREHDWAGIRVDFLLRHLSELRAALEKLGIPLIVESADRFSDAPAALVKMAQQHRCGAIYANREYELNESRRDDCVLNVAAKNSIRVMYFTDQTLCDPAEVRTGAGTFYTVFSPFKRSLYRLLEERGVRCVSQPDPQRPLSIRSSPIPSKLPGFASHVPHAADVWPAGEHQASSMLKTFLSKHALAYKDARDSPAKPGTSRLSPYLAIGSISPRQCVAAALDLNKQQFEKGEPGLVHWISEVAWRDFYRHIMVGFPRVCMGRAFKLETERIAWSENREHFQAWCNGRTGIPIVDAGMRQLQSEGWMHNRVRMIVAMYLTKDLFLPWRWGEQHFMRHLIDGDLGSNNGGWQWSASTGTDAAPYFRIFNPIMQSRKFDAAGTYIRTHVPELAGLDGGEDGPIHDPFDQPLLLPRSFAYPRPLVDRSTVKDRVMAAFKGLSE